MSKIAILGTGSWGLTLAWLWSGACLPGAPSTTAEPTCLQDGSQVSEVWLWGRQADKINQLQANRHVTFPVEVTLPEQLQLTASLQEAVDGADVVVLVVTVAGTRAVLKQLREETSLPGSAILVNASKGIEFPSLTSMSAVFAEEMPEHRYAVLSGPTLAMEILKGLPTACSIACEEMAVAEHLQRLLSHHLFRLYSNTDVIGVELGGALKNIFSIASGYMREKHLGDNAFAALVTRGLYEMTRFSVALGANPETIYGLSGLGDLLATANSPLSRNFQVGARLAKGGDLQDILTDLKVVAEGVKTTHAVDALSRKMGLELPIVQMVETCLSAPFSEEMMIRSLMSRKLKPESLSKTRR